MMITVRYAGLICLVLWANTSFATCSLIEDVRFEGDIYSILESLDNPCHGGAYPLKPLLKCDGQIMKNIVIFHDKYYNDEREAPGMCSQPNSGYRALWDIEDNGLYIVGFIYNPCSRSSRTPDMIPLRILFPDSPRKKLAEWYSGVFYLYKQNDYNRDKKEYAQVVVCRGKVIRYSEIEMHNRKPVNTSPQSDQHLLSECN